MTITTQITAIAYQAASTSLVPWPMSCAIARHPMNTLTPTRNVASASAERCSAFPWPYWWPTSAAPPAPPAGKSVSRAATGSVPECAASERRPRLCVASPVTSLSAISVAAAKTEMSAVRRCGVTAEGYSGHGLERPDHDVLAPREVDKRIAAQVEGRDRREIDLGLGRLDRPELVVDLGACEASSVGRVQAVALRQEPLERARLRVEHGAVRAVAAAKPAPSLFDPRALVRDPLAVTRRRHARVEVRELVRASRGLHGKPARRIEAEEPDPGLVVERDVRPHVQLEERAHAGQRHEPAPAEPGELEGRDPDPGAAVVDVHLELRGDTRPDGVRRDAPVREEQVLPRLAHRPAARGHGPGPVAEVLERPGLA